MGAALLLGRKVIAVSAPGAHVCLMLGSEGCEAVTPMEAQGSLCCFASLPPKGDKNSSVYVAVIADGKGQLEPIEDSKICSAVGPHLDPQHSDTTKERERERGQREGTV